MMRTLNQLTKPKSYLAKQTCSAVSGALIGAATLKSVNGALSSALVSYVLPSSSSPRTRLIASIGFATIKTAIDHYLPNQPIISICTALLPVLTLALHLDVAHIVSIASLGLLGTYVPSVVSYVAQDHFMNVALVASLVGEVVCSLMLSLGGTLHLWPIPREEISFNVIPYLAVGLAASFLAFRALRGPHNLYLHSGLLIVISLVGCIYARCFNVPTQNANSPVLGYVPAAVQAVALPQQGGGVSFLNGIPDGLKKDPIFKLFKCSTTDKPICYNPCVHVNLNSLFDGNSRIKRQYSSLICLPKVNALIEERKSEYLRGFQSPLKERQRQLIREAHDELVKICPRLKIIPKLKNLLDNNEVSPLMFPMESDDSNSDSETNDSFRAPSRPSQITHETELRSSPVQSIGMDIFDDGIPYHLEDDPIFSLFICDLTNKHICFDPYLCQNLKSICENNYQPIRGFSSFIPLLKVKALLEERKRMCRLDPPSQRVRVEFLKDAYEELLQFCPDSKIIPKLKTLIDTQMSPSPYIFPMETEERNSDPDIDTTDLFRAYQLRSQEDSDTDANGLYSAPLSYIKPIKRGLFAAGIPARFADDCIFRLFKSPVTDRPIWIDPVYCRLTRKICELRREKCITLPNVHALIKERMEMYEQGNESELPSFGALNAAYLELMSIDRNLGVLKELECLMNLTRRESSGSASDNSLPGSPRVANSNNPEPISFAEGIPLKLEDDIVFKHFECGIDQGPTCDLVLDPTDKKTFYHRKSIHNWLGRNQISPKTRDPLTLAKLVEMPNVNRLITERQEFYKTTKLPIAQALQTLPLNLNCVKEAVAEMEAKCPGAAACAGLRSILQSMIDQDTTQWNFAEKIPPQLRDDCVFKLFICPSTDTPIYDCVLDPNKANIYEQKWIIDTWLINMKSSPATGKPLKKEDLIPLSQVSLLIHQRQKFYKGLVDAKTPIEVIREHQKSCTDKKLLATACEELKKHCGANSEIYKKLRALN